jgi:hypothetical protein
MMHNKFLYFQSSHNTKWHNIKVKLAKRLEDEGSSKPFAASVLIGAVWSAPLPGGS